MRASVLADPRLAKHARRFVWLSIDTENPRNASFLERFPIEVWPTFFVVGPGGQQVMERWLGGATVSQLDHVLVSGERSAQAAPSSPALTTGFDRVGANGSVESLVATEQASGRLEGCASIAREQGPSLPRGPAFAQVAAAGLSCALDAPADASWRSAALDALEPLASEAIRLPRLLADDRAALYDVLVQVRGARGDRPGARRLAEQWWRFLEAEGRRARGAESRAALDSWRVEAALALEDPARALPSLARSERELPHDYNPPARRAYLFRELGRLSEARDAAERALQRAYGPRKLRIYDLTASILERQGDRAALVEEVDAALAYAERLPPSQRSERVIAALRARRSGIEAPRE